MTASRIALVTGASGGLGPAICRALADDRARVVAHYRRNAKAAEDVVAGIVDAGGQAEAVAFDLRDPGSIREAVDGLVDRHGGIDVLVNNAGIVADGPFAMLEEADWTDVIDTNLSGTFRVCRAVARSMLGRRAGVIVNVASVAGLRASPMQANYSAAKAGILGLSRTLARELGPRGIRVNTVIPGLIAAGMGARVHRRHAEALVDRIPLGRTGEPEEVAAAVAFLASERASYISGAELTVDGALST